MDAYPHLQQLAIWPGAVLRILDEPHLTVAGQRVEIPGCARRLVAYVALKRRIVSRHQVSLALWPDATESRASGNLRSVLWRLRAHPITLLNAEGATLRIAQDLVVDEIALTAWLDRIARGTLADDDLVITTDHLSGLDLLPGWYDDFVLFEREHLRQRTLNALETLTAHLIDDDRPRHAAEVALIAIDADPLRESAQHLLISTYLAQGNVADALAAYRRYRQILHRELGIAPSPTLQRLLERVIRPHTLHAVVSVGV